MATSFQSIGQGQVGDSGCNALAYPTKSQIRQEQGAGMPFVNPDQSTPIQLWMDYCIARGLTPDIIGPMNGHLMELERAAEFLGQGIFGFKAAGAVAVFVFPLSPGEFQGRLIYDPIRSNVVPLPGVELRKKPPKYFRPKNSPNVLYIPPHLTDWHEGAKYNLLIVEGAINAVRLAASGYHAVAVTGVHNYHTGGKHTPIINELSRLIQSTQAEKITILFDSDTADQEGKRELWNGIHNLAQDLMRLRPQRRDTIYICRPPPKANGDKRGPDDYLHERGIDEFNRLLSQESEKYDDAPYFQIERKALDRFVYEQHSGRWFDCDERQLIGSDHTNDILNTFGMVDDITSKRPMATLYTVKRLLAAPNLRIARNVAFQPDEEQIYFRDEDGMYKVNRFDPKDLPQGIPGDLSIWYAMLRSVCRDDLSVIPKLEVVWAYQHQFPAVTPKYAILLTGEQRSGKTNIASAVGLAISKSYAPFRPNLDSEFNSNWTTQRFREFAEFNPKMDAEWLKDLITGKYIEVRTKYGANYRERNFSLNIFTCNGLQSKIQEGDKRFIVGGYARSDNQKLGLAFERWVNSMGPSHLRHHFLNDIDVSGYDDLDTASMMKDQVVDASKSYKSTVKDFLVEACEEIGLECFPVPLVTIWLRQEHNVPSISFMKENSHYFPKPKCEKVKIKGDPIRFRVISNFEKWLNCSDTDEYRKQYDIATKLININTKKYFP